MGYSMGAGGQAPQDLLAARPSCKTALLGAGPGPSSKSGLFMRHNLAGGRRSGWRRPTTPFGTGQQGGQGWWGFAGERHHAHRSRTTPPGEAARLALARQETLQRRGRAELLRAVVETSSLHRHPGGSRPSPSSKASSTSSREGILRSHRLRPSAPSPIRPTCWPSTRPSRRRRPGSRDAALRWWRTRCASWQPARPLSTDEIARGGAEEPGADRQGDRGHGQGGQQRQNSASSRSPAPPG